MAELSPSLVDLLVRAGRGGAASVPLLGPFLEQTIFGTLDDKDAREDRENLHAALAEISSRQAQTGQSLELILQEVRRHAATSAESGKRIDEALTAIRSSPKPKSDDAIPTVFISSTIEDLKPHRKAAQEAAIRAGFLPIMSEDFAASRHATPLKICKERVAQVDTLAVIVGHRYGWAPPEEEEADQRSITWIECATAVEHGKEVLAFLVDDEYRGLDGWKESLRLTKALEAGDDITELAPTVQRNTRGLERFRSWLSGHENKFLRKTFQSPDKLSFELLDALNHWRDRQTKFARPAHLVEAEGDPRTYLEKLRNRTAKISIQGLSTDAKAASEFPIEEVFIPLSTNRPSPDEAHADPGRRRSVDMSRNVSLREALKSRRVVLVGDPGSGKTTFLRRTAYALCQTLLGEDASAARERLGLQDAKLPILIRVGDLVGHIQTTIKSGGDHPAKRESPDWLPGYLARQSEVNGWDLGKAFFRRKLQGGEAMVLLDGLDEAPNQHVRKQVAALIQAAAQDAFSKCRFVVSTRPHAYRTLHLAGFDEFTIADLDDETIEESILRWAKALFGESDEKASRHCSELMTALRRRPEIRRMCRTPVMLTSLTVVHWNRKRLPELRADLYESVVKWLVEHKAQDGGLLPEARLEHLQELAFRMHSRPSGRQETVELDWAAKQIEARFEGEVKKERQDAAEAFLDDESNRSGIVSLRLPSIRFWHLTFQEYLTARRIAGELEEEQAKLLFDKGRLYAPEWAEVILLYAGVLRVNQNSEKKVDDFVRRILESIKAGSLAEQARGIGLIGGIVRDLAPLKYTPKNPLYDGMRQAVMGIFDPEKSQSVPFEDRLAAADALGQAGDPRFTGPDSSEKNWVRIDGGSFLVGQGKNRRTKTLGPFDIGRYPVTVLEYRLFVEDDGGYPAGRWWKHDWRPEQRQPVNWDGQLAYPMNPVTHVNWYEASAYCNWLSNRTKTTIRLPTEWEWERVASGGEERTYPWGEKEPNPSLANFDGGAGRATPAGLYPQGVSKDGVLDMAGNVFEWCSDISEDSAPIRGGSWNNGARYLRCSVRNRDEPDFGNDIIGFRCVREVSSL